MAEILIIDDDPLICKTLTFAIQRMNHHADHALTLQDGLARVGQTPYDVVLLDVNLPDGNGLEAIPAIHNSLSGPEVIIFTGHGDPDGAELAIRSGAWDYIEKPPSIKAVTLPLTRALQYRTEKQALRQKRALNRDKIIARSPAIALCLDAVAQAAATESAVLITGETGTGKELFARTIHHNSRRAKANFVVVDCAALPETLVESTLFGHVKGAFTGATENRKGLIQMADGGTLFLDEIGELAKNMQKSFLRVLQEKQFRPVGSEKEQHSDFRLICATHRDLGAMAEGGAFRTDLLYRIRTMSIVLPPLTDRLEDIRDLTLHFTMGVCERYGIDIKGVSSEFIDDLRQYDWPGNVRELANTVEETIVRAGSEPTLKTNHLPEAVRIGIARNRFRPQPAPVDSQAEEAMTHQSFKTFRDNALAEAECRYLQNLMTASGFHVPTACRQSELSRPRLYALLKKHGIFRPE